ncbi:MAG: hypothetical protein ILP02_05060, partial [Clostridia bacterium]|nr:hypothetical protein [Clostridia bacterium]
AAKAKAYDDPIYGYRKNLAGAYAGSVEPDYYIETSDRQNYKIVESINWFYVQTDPRLKGSGLSKPAKRLPGAAGDGSFALSRKILVRKLE